MELGLYPGFNAVANQRFGVRSSDAADAGTLESSGTVTSANANQLRDTGATFVTDGVTVGDFVINDTNPSHALIVAVTETQLTTWHWTDGGSNEEYVPSVGDAYRVVSPASTGASFARLDNLLDEDYVRLPSEYVILNGTTEVFTTAQGIRCSRGRAFGGGSGDTNAGDIEIRQETTTANIFAQIAAGTGQTTLGLDTIAASEVGVMTDFTANISRASGNAGSANGRLLVRGRGEIWRAAKNFQATNQSPL